MIRSFRAALALACVAPFAVLGGCNLTASQEQIQAAINPAAIAVGSLTPANLQAAGINSPQAQAFATKVQQVATTACSFEPSFEGIAALVAAAYPPAAPAISVSKIAGLACTAYKQRLTTAYTALEAPKKGTTPKPPAKPEPKPGDPVDGVININGQTIVVPGVKK
ncbi:hypothetical protein CIW48_27285 [Methylobacterium sp. P1-11]|uniref:hypothetical protein n=1 Tax=Methylobacterium sp. P1-11 TaxID=2024616 RepID=UPI0011EFCEB5|nr:hypothetical protein [Methylobacterium sp. P1-11]KAA0117906.1 hypothetical protein CIW48_27285 [Methylobacterium sp. P1-11]